MILSLVFAVASLVLLALILRQRHRNTVTAAYCDGFRDGVAYEAKVQAKQGRRVVVQTVMSLN